MALPNRIAAYDDCLSAYEEASATGARVKFATYAEGHMFMMRLHNARALLRKESERMYKPEDPQWGKTDYDRLTVRAPVEDTEGLWWVYIEVTGSNILALERLEGPPPVLQLTPRELPRVSDQSDDLN